MLEMWKKSFKWSFPLSKEEILLCENSRCKLVNDDCKEKLCKDIYKNMNSCFGFKIIASWLSKKFNNFWNCLLIKFFNFVLLSWIVKKYYKNAENY